MKYKNKLPKIYFILMCIVNIVSIKTSVCAAIVDERILYPAKVNTIQGNQYGYIDETSKWVVEAIYDAAYPFKENRAIVEKNGLYGAIDSRGKEIIRPIYQSLSSFSNGLAIYSDGKGMGVLDDKGNIVSEKSYAFVNHYSQELAQVAGTNEKGEYRYGYIDKNGNEIIPLIYKQAEDFQPEGALVKDEDNSYQIINKKNEVITRLPYPYAYGLQDNRLLYMETLGGNTGYLNAKGEVVIKPQYKMATPFKEGVAIATTAENIGQEGLIDLKGTYIYPSIYNSILVLGEERVALGKTINSENPMEGSIYAIGDTKGNILTDFIYYGISPYDEGKASAYDAKYTYFVDLTGGIIKELPYVEGAGTLKLKDTVVEADIDYNVYYLKKNGETLYKPNVVVKLSNQYSVLEKKYKPNLNYLVYYPHIQGLEKNDVNRQLKDLSGAKKTLAQQATDYSYYSKFDILFYNKNLLILKIMSSTYYFGGAHPLPSMNTPAINLETGKIYTLSDLFLKDRPWKVQIQDILEKIRKTNPDYQGLYEEVKLLVDEKQPFYMDQEALYIYYSPYDVAPYAAGFVTFKIPYSQIEDIIDKNGSLWMSYH